MKELGRRCARIRADGLLCQGKGVGLQATPLHAACGAVRLHLASQVR
jgi:hypothetical protein